jgi:hypothetical protein
MVWHGRCTAIRGMRADQRALVTTENVRRGSLPRPTADAPAAAASSGLPCDGCGEAVYPSAPVQQVTVRGMARLRFHPECYSAWASFAP